MEGRSHQRQSSQVPHLMGQGLGTRGLFPIGCSRVFCAAPPCHLRAQWKSQSWFKVQSTGRNCTNVSRRHLGSKRTGVLGPVCIVATCMASCSHTHPSKMCGELHCHSTLRHATPRGHELVAVWRLRGRGGLISEFLILCSVPSRAARLRLHVGFCRLRKRCTDCMSDIF